MSRNNKLRSFRSQPSSPDLILDNQQICLIDNEDNDISDIPFSVRDEFNQSQLQDQSPTVTQKSERTDQNNFNLLDMIQQVSKQVSTDVTDLEQTQKLINIKFLETQSAYVDSQDINRSLSIVKQNQLKDDQVQSYLSNHSKQSGLKVEIDNNSDQIIAEPIPILPKKTSLIQKNTTCSLRHIKFNQLKEFKSFDKPNVVDLLGEKFNQTKNKDFGRPRNIQEIADQYQLFPSESRQIMRGIIFLRDTTILENLNKKINQLTQRDVFHHENFLNVNDLIKERELLEKWEGLDEGSPLMKARKRLISNQNTVYDFSAFKQINRTADDLTLTFESRFESGNLFLAQKVSDQEYNCLMQNDINSKGHTQWFFFRVQNTRKGHSVKFNIQNYSKGDSMFNYGMKITCYSEKKAQEQDIGWH